MRGCNPPPPLNTEYSLIYTLNTEYSLILVLNTEYHLILNTLNTEYSLILIMNTEYYLILKFIFQGKANLIDSFPITGRSKAAVLLWFSVVCFGVRVSVTLFVHIILSSVWYTEGTFNDIYDERVA